MDRCQTHDKGFCLHFMLNLESVEYLFQIKLPTLSRFSLYFITNWHCFINSSLTTSPWQGMCDCRRNTPDNVVRAPLFQEVHYKVNDRKAHSKGGTLENTINGRADEEAPPPPPGLTPPQKDPAKVSIVPDLSVLNLSIHVHPKWTYKKRTCIHTCLIFNTSWSSRMMRSVHVPANYGTFHREREVHVLCETALTVGVTSIDENFVHSFLQSWISNKSSHV